MRKNVAYAESYRVLSRYGLTHDHLRYLHRQEAALHNLFERMASGYPVWYQGRIIMDWDAAAYARDERKVDAIEARVARVLAPFGITVTVNGDPRGCALHLHLPPDDTGRVPTNSFGRDSWVIDW